jgi:hypothetical protein
MVIKAKWNGNADVHMYTFTFFGIKLYGDLPKKNCSDPDVHIVKNRKFVNCAYHVLFLIDLLVKALAI